MKQTSTAEELSGKLAQDLTDEKLMRSVLQADKKTIDEGKLIADALNRNIGLFTPDLLFSQMAKNFTLAKQLLGDTIIRLVSGYDPNYVEKNLAIPEFRQELYKNLRKNIEQLKEAELVSADGTVTDKGIGLAAMVLYMEELDKLTNAAREGRADTMHKKQGEEKGERRPYRKGDSYRDIDVRATVKAAVRRQRRQLTEHELHAAKRTSKGNITIIYGLDASASMKGDKLKTAKKAGIALAYHAIDRKDKVGLIVFGNKVRTVVEPSNDFPHLLREIAIVRAANETDYTGMVQHALESFHSEGAKHLVLLTDALPTVGEQPAQETLEAVSSARAAGITVSIVGINLDKQGKQLAERIAKVGDGRFLVVTDLEQVDQLVLEDYFAAKSAV
ncbi:VWA domain-containing protein [Candidatus Woesearchaeota archaeon]|nr:VWA domain-containing protein [Candidatus Woesearchaeota archaeon]